MPNSVLNILDRGRSRLAGPAGSFDIYFEDRPDCIAGCPAGVDVKAYVNLIADRRYERAVEIVRRANPFPGICGRVCTHPCEAECGRRDIDESISIMHLKRFAADYERSRKAPGRPAENTKEHRIAVVGSGPGGLTAANDLALAGFSVTIFEEGKEPGGLLSWGIPDFRLPKDIVINDIREILALGIKLIAGKRVENPPELLKQGYSAVVLAMGCQKPVKLQMDGAENAMDCLEFLRGVSTGGITELPGRTVIIGGGNAALDSARTALRLGSQVTVAYRRTREEMPAEDMEIQQAMDEGVDFKFLALPDSITSGGMRFQKAQLGEPDESGRRRPVPLPDQYFTIETDNIILALGSKPDITFGGLEQKPWGTLAVNELAMTSIPGIFAAGDIVSGPSSIVEAIGGGHAAANGIVKYLLDSEGGFGSTGNREMLIVESPEPEPAERACLECISSERRQTTFDEVELGMPEAEAVTEANRCRRCGSCMLCDTCLSVCEYRNAVITINDTGEKELAKVPFELANGPGEGWSIKDGDDTFPVTVESLLAKVNANLCIACGRCEDSCPYKAIRTVFDTQGNVHALVDASACRGCGACTAICPTGAMGMGYFGNDELLPKLHEAVRESPDGIVGFSCVWHDFDAGLEPGPGGIALQCTRRASPALILEALASGARIVAVYGCRDDECHYLPGPWMGPDVVESCRNILENIGIDPARVQYLDDDSPELKSAELPPLQPNVDRMPDTRAPTGRALNAIQILMAQPDVEHAAARDGKYLLGQGCLAMSEPLFRAHGFERPDIMGAIMGLLGNAGIDVQQAPGIHISGDSLGEWGMEELRRHYSDSIVRQAGDRGLIIPTPKTWLAFRENYPELNIISLPEILTGKLEFEPLDMTVAYHPSCAGGGDFDRHCLGLLAEIPGLRIVELDGQCGDTGWRMVGSGSREMGQALLERVEEAGADMLISSSSRCTAHLTALKSGWCQSGVDVQDIFSFLAGHLSAYKKSGGLE